MSFDLLSILFQPFALALLLASCSESQARVSAETGDARKAKAAHLELTINGELWESEGPLLAQTIASDREELFLSLTGRLTPERMSSASDLESRNLELTIQKSGLGLGEFDLGASSELMGTKRGALANIRISGRGVLPDLHSTDGQLILTRLEIKGPATLGRKAVMTAGTLNGVFRSPDGETYEVSGSFARGNE